MLESRRPYERGREYSWLDARPWVIGLANIVAAALFVAGCVGFYWPGLYTGSVTAFLLGSVLFLVGAVGSALLEHGPAPRRGGERRDGRPMSAPERGL